MGLTQALCAVAALIMLAMGSIPMALLFGLFALFAQGVGNEIDAAQTIPEARQAAGGGALLGILFLVLIVFVAAALSGVITLEGAP